MLKLCAYLPPCGRLLLSGLFVWSGFGKLMNPAGTTQYFASHGVPAPNLIVWIAILIELAGGLAILVGLKTRWVAAILAIWCLITGFAVHLVAGMHSADAVVAVGAGALSVDNGIRPRERGDQTRAVTALLRAARLTYPRPTDIQHGCATGGGSSDYHVQIRRTAMVGTHEPGQAVFRSVMPEDIDWKPFPAFPSTVRLAVLVGEPSQPGPYVIRVKVPSGVKLMPHKHPEDRIYTVMSGVFYIGLGDQFDGDKVKAYPPGCVVILPGDTAHFHWAKSGEYVTQVTAMGPLGLEYMNSNDDPRNRSS